MGALVATRLFGLPDLLVTHRNALGAIVLKLGSAFFSFVTIFLVARSSGASVTGDYAMAVATSTLFSLLAVMGLDQIATRAIGGDLREGRADLARAALMATVRIVAPLSLALGAVLLVAAPLATLINASPSAMRAVAASVIAAPLLRIAVVTLRASGSVMWSQFFDSAHSFIIVTVVALLVMSRETAIGAPAVAGIYSVALLTTMLSCWATLLRRIRGWPRGGMRRAPLLRDSWPILLAGFCHSATEWILLATIGAQLSASQVGAYRVAVQVVTVIALMLTTIESLTGPELAGDFRVNDIGGAWRRHRRASYLMLLAAIAPVLLSMLAPGHILALFGTEFLVAKEALMVLGGAQIVNVLTGPIGAVMVMSGHQRLSLALAIAGLAVAVVLCLVLVPLLGLVGAAIGGASATVLRNVCAYVIMRRRLRA